MFPFFKQPDSTDCGPTCLRMVAQYYGKTLSLQQIRNKLEAGRMGVSILDITEAAEVIGFHTQCVRVSYHDLITKAHLPAILHWDQNHFVVLYSKRKDRMYVADPARGKLSFSEAEFKKYWISNLDTGEGISLFLEPSALFTKDKKGERFAFSNLKNLKKVFSFVKPYKRYFLQLLLGLFAGSLLQLTFPFLAQTIVDVGIANHDLHFVEIILIAQLSLLGGRLSLEFVRGWVLLHVSTRINISILTNFLTTLMKLPISFFDSKNTGDILQRINDRNRIETFLTGTSLNVLFSLVNLVLFSIVLLVFNTKIFFVFILATLLYGFWILLFLKKRRQLDYKHFDLASKEQSVVIELIQGMQEIKINGSENSMRANWEKIQARLFKLSGKSLSINQWQQSGAFFINEGKNFLITFLSAQAVINGDMTLGSMMAVQYIIGQLNSPIEQLVGFIQSLQNVKLSLDRLNEMSDMDQEEPPEKKFFQELPPSFKRQIVGGCSNTGANLLDDSKSIYTYAQPKSKPTPGEYADDYEPSTASIRLKNVSFTYPGTGNEPVLRNINLSLPKGKTTAIVGVSGSGKTTLLKLLLKFYEPQDGAISIDEMPLSNISHKVWRSHCGVVMQDSYIFSDTIARNIAVGFKDIDEFRLNHAIQISNLDNFIKDLPIGVNTKIGNEGIGISFGQKQRILIARAIYRDPLFILLDEATNSLDAKNERVIIKNLSKVFAGRTVVVVAHRLSTVKNADQIVLLNRGLITEIGTHEELVSKKGEYFDLVRNQLELGE